MKTVRNSVLLILLATAMLFSACGSKPSLDRAKRDIIKAEGSTENEKNHLKVVLSVMTEQQVFDCYDYIQNVKAGQTPPPSLQGRIDTISMEYGILKD